ncbi:MAG TPA: hypothetical protein VF134_02670 [Candidatus Dormibacteraeota bacterium]
MAFTWGGSITLGHRLRVLRIRFADSHTGADSDAFGRRPDTDADSGR